MRETIRPMAAETLTDLYKLQPASQAAVQTSAGYLVFNNMCTNLLLLSTARAAGVTVNRKTEKDTFMKMTSVGAGLGVGVTDYRVVFVFETDEALAKFLDSGWLAKRNQTLRPTQVSRAYLTRAPRWRCPECGYTRSPKQVSHSS
jgi:lipid-binding SYLF domain-containing protein